MNLDLTERTLVTQFSSPTPQNCYLFATRIKRNPTLPRCCPAKRAKSTEGYDATTGGELDDKSKIFTRKGPEIEYGVHVMHRTESL
jgi:hypothetical protein